MAVRGEGRPLHACVNSTNYFYIIVFYTVNSLLQQHTQKHVTYGKWVEIIIREFWNFIREKSGKNQGILFSWNAGNPALCVELFVSIEKYVFRLTYHHWVVDWEKVWGPVKCWSLDWGPSWCELPPWLSACHSYYPFQVHGLLVNVMAWFCMGWHRWFRTRGCWYTCSPSLSFNECC